MSRRGERASKSVQEARSDSSFIQERLSARQAKRSAKAAERREKSDALEEEGNRFFRNGDFREALDQYQRAIDVHGPSVKPVLLSNLAAVYLKLGMYSEASGAADRALVGDPKSVKARYRRGIARKHMKMWAAADADFRTVLTLDPGNKKIEDKLEFLEGMRCDHWEEEEEDMNSYSDYEAPGLDDDPNLGESLSESSDCEHSGNGIPCKFYNRTECKNGRACRYSHAPDKKSERDALGRNVCRYYLMGVCKFGERCTYLHSEEYLLQRGWWSTTEGIDRERKRYNLLQMCNKAIADYNAQAKASGTAPVSKKKQPKQKKKNDSRSRSDFVQSSQRSRTKTTAHSYPAWEGYDSDGDIEDGMCGFTGSEVNELISYGVKPWDDDAWDFWHAIHDCY